MVTLPPSANSGNIPEKQCTGPCGRTLPNTLEYFHSNGKSGLYPKCKECKNKQAMACYYMPGIHEQRLADAKAYRDNPENKEQIQATNKAWKALPETKEYLRNYTRDYRTIPEVLEKHRADGREYASRPEVQAHRTEYLRDYLQQPEKRERHRALDRVNHHTRRARKRIVQGAHTSEQIQELLKRQKQKCYYCKAKFEKKSGKYVYHIEHTFPLSRVADTDIPANDISYLVLACPTCNKKKSDKFPWEFPEGGRLL